MKSNASTQKEILIQLQFYHYTIHPFSYFRKFWERLMILTLFLSFVITPYVVTFIFLDDYVKMDSLVVVIISIEMICLLDILLNFFTGFCNEKTGAIVLDRKKIFIKYIKFYFWIDLLSSIPKEFITETEYCEKTCINFSYFCIWNLINILSLLKIFRIGTVFKLLQNHLTFYYGVMTFQFKLIKMSLLLLIIVHWFACLQFFLVRAIHGSSIKELHEFTWTYEDQIFWNSSSFGRYFLCLYRTVYTILIFGHDVYESINYEDIVLTTFLTFLGFYLKIYLMAKILMFIKNRFSPSLKFYQEQKKLKDYMKYRRLPKDIQQRVIAYNDYRFKSRYYNEKLILNVLSDQLKSNIAMTVFATAIKNIRIFDDLPQELIMKIVLNFRQEYYLKGDIILHSDNNEHCLYYISLGTVLIYSKNGHEITRLTDEQSFGEYEMILKIKLDVNCVALENCRVFILNHYDFISIVETYPGYWELIQKRAEENLKQKRHKIVAIVTNDK